MSLIHLLLGHFSLTKLPNLIRRYLYALKQSIESEGFFISFLRIVRRALIELLWIMSLPIAILAHFLRIRLLNIKVEHIGHLAEEINTFLKARELGLVPNCHYFMCVDSNNISNAHLLSEYWSKYLTIYKSQILLFFSSIVFRRKFGRYDISKYVANYETTQEIYLISKLWGEKDPLLKLSDDDDLWSKSQLRKLGIPDGQWFVCVHAREGGFWQQNEFMQSHRNSSIENTYLAMSEIIKRGGICVRMGDASMKKIPPMKGVIDYAHSTIKSDRLDIVLCAKATFFLGNTSGISFVSSVFGVPVALANMIPVAAVAVNRADLSIPKFIYSKKSGRLLRLYEILNSSFANASYKFEYEDNELEVIENSPRDILNLVLDMFDEIDGVSSTTNDEIFLSTYLNNLLKPGNYGYGAVSKGSKRFMKENYEVLTGKEFSPL